MKKWFFLVVIFLVFPLIIYSQTNENTEKLDKPSRDMAKEEVIWQELKSPDLVNIWKKATEALDKDDYQTAAQLYEKVLAKSPKFDRKQPAASYRVLTRVDKRVSCRL